MNELEEAWSQKLASAIEDARNAGQGDLADYLTLKAENDAIRIGGVRWLFETLVAAASELNREHAGISMERVDPHNFPYRGANIVGTLLRIRHGVRCLTFEAGWTRTPSDGFMRGGALAFARITHFGMKWENAEMILISKGDGAVWSIIEGGEAARVLDPDYLRGHVRVFLGDTEAQ